MFKKILFTLVLSLFVFNLEAYEVNTDQSNFTWRGKKVTGEHYGPIKIKSSKVEFDGKKFKKAVFIMDMNSIDVTDIEEGKWKTKFLNHMKSDDFFNVSKYPTATLTIDELKKNTAHGKLTIKDKTHPIKIKFNQRKNTYSGKMSFDRTKYDMIYKSGNYFKDLGDKLIYDEVELEFQVVLKK